MSWEYQQSTGSFYDEDAFLATGYSGKESGRNNPALQSDHFYGPIPQGGYHIGRVFSDPILGTLVMELTPYWGTETFGRVNLCICGEGAASAGSIVLNDAARLEIAKSDDRVLVVVA